MYEVDKNLNRLANGQTTYFLDINEERQIKAKLGKKKYFVFKPTKDSEKTIIYFDKEPDVILYEIKCSKELRHQDILGTMFSLNISKEMYGDIIIHNGHYYIYILKLFQNYFETNFSMVSNASVQLQILDLDYLKDYQREYITVEAIVSSERIDTVIAKLIGVSRNIIKDKVRDKEILLNCEILKNLSYILKKDDTFSIRKIGKFKYIGVSKSTKSKNLVVTVLKYI